MNELVIYDGGTLQHHGVLGMKWGVRRYQNKDGSLTSAGMKRYGVGSDGRMSSEGKKIYKADKKQQKKERKEFDYKKSNVYKNGSVPYEKAKITNNYNFDTAMYGKKSANKIAYDVLVDGKTYKSARLKQAASQVAKGLALEVGVIAGTNLVMEGKRKYDTAKMRAQLASSLVGKYGSAAGLNIVKGGYTTGIKHVKAGKAIMNYAMGRH